MDLTSYSEPNAHENRDMGLSVLVQNHNYPLKDKTGNSAYKSHEETQTNNQLSDFSSTSVAPSPKAICSNQGLEQVLI